MTLTCRAQIKPPVLVFPSPPLVPDTIFLYSRGALQSQNSFIVSADSNFLIGESAQLHFLLRSKRAWLSEPRLVRVYFYFLPFGTPSPNWLALSSNHPRQHPRTKPSPSAVQPVRTSAQSCPQQPTEGLLHRHIPIILSHRRIPSLPPVELLWSHQTTFHSTTRSGDWKTTRQSVSHKPSTSQIRQLQSSRAFQLVFTSQPCPNFPTSLVALELQRDRNA